MSDYTKKLEKAVNKQFAEADRHIALRELNSISLKHVMAESKFNLGNTWAAILSLSGDDIDKLRDLVRIAKLDFRDVIYMASQAGDKD